MATDYLDLVGRLLGGNAAPAAPPALPVRLGAAPPDLPVRFDPGDFGLGALRGGRGLFGVSEGPDLPVRLGFDAPSLAVRRPREDATTTEKDPTAVRRPGQKPGPSAAAGQGAPGSIAGIPAEQQAVAQTIVADAVKRFGPQAGPVVAALLVQEAGLGGAVGDTNLNPVGSHGPFQFYGGGGQLNAYAAARGISLEQAGQLARTNPQDAATWAFENYLGNALRQGIQRGESGEQLLRTVLAGGQNPGAVNSPQHWSGYQRALQNVQAGWGTPAQNRAVWGGGTTESVGAVANPAPSAAPGGRVFPVQGYTGRVEPHWGSVRGGADIMAPAGTPVQAMAAGTVVAARWDDTGGWTVFIQGDDGLQYYYAHLQRQPAVQSRQRVQPGTALGFVGNSGNARNTPPHLHLGIGPTIVNGTGPQGGTGGDFDAQSILQALLGGR